MLLSICVIILAIPLLAVLFYKMQARAKSLYWAKRGYPAYGPEVGGNTFVTVLKKIPIHEIHGKMYKKMERENISIVGLSYPLQKENILFVKDLELVKHIMVKNFDHFVNRRSMNLSKADIHFSRSVFSMNGEEWKQLRNKITPAFTTGKIKKMFSIFETSSEKLATYIKKLAENNQGNLNFIDCASKYAMDVIASSAFGLDGQVFDQDESIFEKNGKKMQIHMSLTMLLKFITIGVAPKIANWLRFSIFDKEADNFFSNVIYAAIKHRDSTGVKANDFLQLMLEARDGQLKAEEGDDGDDLKLESTGEKKDGKLILDEDTIVAQCVLFFLAGYDTLQTLLSFSLYQLALNPDMQERLYREIEEAADEKTKKVSYEKLHSLTFLDGVVTETLRMYPAVTRLDRRCNKTFQVPGSNQIILKGDLVAIPVMCIHYDEKYYPEPTKFNPDRFSSQTKNERNPYAYLAFGQGPRNCIGMRFALTEGKLAIVHIVQNFIITPCAKTTIPMKFSTAVNLKPIDGMWLNFKQRNYPQDK